jgi:tRNA/tmRNA/rRNA uracil-C5-methylase (TrmA/RlmC/RlmD family)
VLRLTVGGPAHGGSCVARADDGRTVFVRHALPGEVVDAVVTDDRGRYLRADAVVVHEPSPDRVVPPCPYAGPGRCGGCDWQHADLAAQRRIKGAVVREQLQRLAGLDPGELVAEAVPGDAAGLGWRTRVQFAVAPDGRVGLRRHRSHGVEPVAACLIASEGVESVGVERHSWPHASAVEVVAGGSGDRAVVVEGAVPGGLLAPEVSVLRARRRGVEAVRGRPGVREVALGRTWWVSGSGFWQVHPGAAETLSAAVVAALAPRAGDLALDLYGGVGLFAAALAPHVREVVSVEADAQACADARQNLRDLDRVRVVEGRTETALARLGLGRADVVVLDPPRAGAGAVVVAQVAALAPRAVAHVACDPAALARDLAAFAEAGYRLAGLRVLDLFPMTHHVECVATLAPAA